MSICCVAAVDEKMSAIISGYKDPNFCFLAGCKLWSGTIVTKVWEMKSLECLGRCKTTHLECSDCVTKIEQSIDNQLEVRI